MTSTRKQLAFLAALLVSTTAFAQYVWLDERGGKQYSDRPPPSSVPASRILKQPGGVRPDAAPAAESQPAPATTTASSIAEQNAEFRKRKTEQAEKDKKAADEAKAATDKSKNCERAREYQHSLESGVRIARTDAAGERSFLTDEQRERELRETRRILNDCK
jgi:hypothetical protein